MFVSALSRKHSAASQPVVLLQGCTRDKQLAPSPRAHHSGQSSIAHLSVDAHSYLSRHKLASYGPLSAVYAEYVPKYPAVVESVQVRACSRAVCKAVAHGLKVPGADLGGPHARRTSTA